MPDGVVYSDKYCVEKCFQNKLILRVLLSFDQIGGFISESFTVRTRRQKH